MYWIELLRNPDREGPAREETRRLGVCFDDADAALRCAQRLWSTRRAELRCIQIINGAGVAVGAMGSRPEIKS